jgi:hypothetical protein
MGALIPATLNLGTLVGRLAFPVTAVAGARFFFSHPTDVSHPTE